MFSDLELMGIGRDNAIVATEAYCICQRLEEYVDERKVMKATVAEYLSDSDFCSEVVFFDNDNGFHPISRYDMGRFICENGKCPPWWEAMVAFMDGAEHS